MRECKRCGGSALRDYAYGCDHVFDDTPSPLVEIVEVRGESVYHASHDGAAPHVLHPGEVGVREGWREAWRDKAHEDALHREAERGREEARLHGVALHDSVPINDGSDESFTWVQIGAGTITDERRAELEREAQVRAAALALTPNERAVLRFAACMPGATLGLVDVYDLIAIAGSLIDLGLLTGADGVYMTTTLGADVAGIV